MSGQTLAWIIISVATLIGASAMWITFSRHQIGGFARTSIIALLVALFLVPAPVPGYESELAPAFIVLIFEVFFQIEGQPQGSMRNLLIGVVVALLLSVLAHFLLRRFAPRVPDEPATGSEAEPG
ncbi:MAG: hypothetical protein ACFHXK_14285 [bacterium]